MDLKMMRNKKGITQAELAQELGVSQRAVAAYELGERRPSPEIANKLRQIFELSVEEIWEMFYGAYEGTKGHEAQDAE